MNIFQKYFLIDLKSVLETTCDLRRIHQLKHQAKVFDYPDIFQLLKDIENEISFEKKEGIKTKLLHLLGSKNLDLTDVPPFIELKPEIVHETVSKLHPQLIIECSGDTLIFSKISTAENILEWLLEIAENTWKHNQGKEVLSLKIRFLRDSHNQLISFFDNGNGIIEDSSRRSGLSIIASEVKNFKGTFSFTSTLNKGMRGEIILPNEF